MDKSTLSNYGWIVIACLVLCVMIALASPFGHFIEGGVKSTVQGLFDVNQNAGAIVGLNIPDQTIAEPSDNNNGNQGETGNSNNTKTYAATFSDNSWEDIITACKNDEVPETWKVGDSKIMIIDGAEYTIDIIGKHHDVYSDGSGTAPLTFQMHEYYPTKYVVNSYDWNGTSWGSSQLRARMTEIENLMPEEIRNAIKEVNKLTNAGNRSKTLITTSDRLFVLAAAEYGETSGFADTNEGTKYAYYEAGNSKGKGDWQWTRSPNANTSDAWVSINPSGYVYSDMATWSRTVAPAFCF